MSLPAGDYTDGVETFLETKNEEETSSNLDTIANSLCISNM